MERCNDCRDLLWEDLYGLLEPSEQDRLRSHLASCPACQQARAQVLAQQRLLAQTARLDVDIPLFKLPINAKPSQPVILRPSFLNARWARYALAAAAALLLVLLPLGIYQQGRHVREIALQDAEERLSAIIRQQGEARGRFQGDENELLHRVYASHTQLRVQGPTRYRPDGFNQYVLFAPAVPISARVVDVRTRRPIFEQKFTARNIDAEVVFTLPANLPLTSRTSARLEFAAGEGAARAQLQAPLPVDDPADVTRLITDKNIYHPGETIYFDSLTVDRQTFKPPSAPPILSCTLLGPERNVVAKVQGKSAADGTGAGHLTLPADCPEGAYLLTVEAADDEFLPVKRALSVRKTVLPAAAKTDMLRVQLVPEGGTLIAGVPCRVFLLAQTLQGQPVDLEAQIVKDDERVFSGISRSSKVANVKTKVPGLGEFTLTPAFGEYYSIKATSTGQPVAGSEVHVEKYGLGLAVSQGVLQAGEPIRLTLHNQWAERQVAVRVDHNGKLVSEKRVSLRPGKNDIELPPEGSGALHVLVSEVRGEQLLPLAERLVYRYPDRRLAIGVQPGKEQYAPGETVSLKVDSRNEQGQVDPAWLTVATVDRNVAGKLVQPADFDLDDADHFPTWRAEGANPRNDALDLFLGLQVWRQSEHLGLMPADETLVLDNSEAVRRATLKELKPALAKLEADFMVRSQELETERDEQLGTLGLARQSLNDYETRAARFSFAAFWTCAGLALVLGIARFVLTFRVRPALTGGFALASVCAAGLLVASLSVTEPGEQEQPPPGLSENILRAHEAEQSALVARIKDLRRLAPEPATTSVIGFIGKNGKSSKPKISQPLPAEQPFAYHRPPSGVEKTPPETIYWNPNLFAANGTAEIKFDLPMRPASYVVHIEAHDAEGRLAAFETTVECSANIK
jgi:hypothetical protein